MWTAASGAGGRWNCTHCGADNSAASDRCENADCRLQFSRVGLLYHGATRLVSRTLSRVSRTFSEATCSTSAPSPLTVSSLSSLSSEGAWLCTSCSTCNDGGDRVCANADCKLAFEVSGVVQPREGQRPRRGEPPPAAEASSSASTSSENGDSDDPSPPPPPRPPRLAIKRGREEPQAAGAAAAPLPRRPRVSAGAEPAARRPPSLLLRIVKPEAGGAAGAASTSPHLAEYITSPDPPPRTSSPPAAAPPGPYKRPPGRAPKGTRWDSTEGEWVPEEAQFTGAWARRATPDAADGAGGSVAKFKVDGERYTVTLHHSCQRRAAPRAALKQLEKLCQQTLPNLPTGLISPLLHADASSHLLLTDCDGRVKAALTFRLVTLHHMGTHAPSNASIEQLLCDVVLLAVAPDAQCRGHGSRLLGLARQQLRDAAARVGSPAHTLLVQADDTAAAFWRKQGFRASAAARELVSELCAWRAAENPKFWGATPMVATMGGKAPRAGARPAGDDDDAPLHTPL